MCSRAVTENWGAKRSSLFSLTQGAWEEGARLQICASSAFTHSRRHRDTLSFAAFVSPDDRWHVPYMAMCVWLGESLEHSFISNASNGATGEWSPDALAFSKAMASDSRDVRARALARELVKIAAELDSMRLT